ncbi:MAG TPA: hypothetical protein VHQ42_03915, partial [Candidatus Limnocylindria bacterium]|nr:hypothetical protein [Candidatus Limnocylindria bacterium]
MDDPSHQPPDIRIRSLAGVDRAVQDPVVADPQPMPGRRSRKRLGVQVRCSAAQCLERRSDSSELHARADAAQVALGAPRQDDANHPEASVLLEL